MTDAVMRDVRPLRHIHVVGGPGSGKSTLARRLSTSLRIPSFGLDDIASSPGVDAGFRPGLGVDERRRRIDEIAVGESWITEGTWLWWSDRVFRDADLIVWLDVPWRTATRRIVARHIREYFSEVRDARGVRARLRALRYPHLRHLREFLAWTTSYYRDARANEPADPDDVAALTRAATRARLAPFDAKTLREANAAQAYRRIVERDADGATAAGSAYAALHRADWVPAHYDDVMYAPSSYDSHIWEIERPVVRHIVAAHVRPGRDAYLDFACGTGRIMAAVDDLVGPVTGVDISAQMLSHAAQRVPRATLRAGDVLAEPDLVAREFDVVTAFRFFLNTESALRGRIMRDLASRLRGPDARLVFNIHGNSRSSLAITSLYRRLRGWGRLNTLSPTEVARLVRDAGLEVEAAYGFGLWPPRLYRTRIGALLRRADRFAVGVPALRWVSHDLLYVCRPRRGTR